MVRRRRGLFRPRNVALSDKRSPMLRLLQDANVNGAIEPNYPAQFPTLFKAQRLGYVDDRQRITDKGFAFITEQAK
jgi:hypothetical protein